MSTKTGTGSGRLDALDAFRGLTIAAMIVVNNPGSWSHVYPPLLHAPWHGWTPTDLVFPSFLFIAGAAVPFALGKRRERGDSGRALAMKVVRRSAILFGLGLFLNAVPDFDLDELRVMGVLQRIALCYLVVGLLAIKTGWRAQALIAAALLAGHALLLSTTSAPGFPAGDLSQKGNFAAAVDRALLSGHTWKPDYDPEGLVSTLGALAGTLIGALAGHGLRSGAAPLRKGLGLIGAGALMVPLGTAWGLAHPINKALWTSSFVVLSSGWALLGLGAFFLVMDVGGRKRWAGPLLAFGLNPIAAYVLSSLTADLLPMVKVVAGGKDVPIKTAAWEWAQTGLGPQGASLVCALLYLTIWWGVVEVMRWRGWALRV